MADFQFGGGTALNIAPDVPTYTAQKDASDSALSVQQNNAKRQALGVLANVDVNDPDSINKGMNALLASGQATQAAELANLQYTRWQRQTGQQIVGALSQTPAGQALLGGAMGGQAPQQQAPQQQAPQQQTEQQMNPQQMEMALHQHLIGDFQQAAQITDPDKLAAFKQSMHQKYDGIIGPDRVEQELSTEKNPSDYLAKAVEHAKAAEALRQQMSGAQSPQNASGQAPQGQVASTQPQGVQGSTAAPVNPSSAPAGSPGNLVGQGQMAVEANHAIAGQAPQADPNETLWNGVKRGQAQVLASPQAAALASALKTTVGIDLTPVIKTGQDALDPDKSAATTRATGVATNDTQAAKSVADLFLPKETSLTTKNGSTVIFKNDAEKIAALSAPDAAQKYGEDVVQKGLAQAGLKVSMEHFYDPTTGADLGERPVTELQKIQTANNQGGQGQTVITDRADRNNNYGNVKAIPGHPYPGQVATDAQGFAIFKDVASGNAAMDRTILQRQTLHGLNTIDGIIADPKYGYDPNNHQYAATVAAALGVKPTDTVDLHDPTIRQKMMSVMQPIERGTVRSSQAPTPQMGTAPAAQQTYNTDQNANYNTNLKTAQENIQSYPMKVNTGMQIKGLASQVGAGPSAQFQQNLANILSPIFPQAANHAANAQQLEADLATGFKNVMTSGVRSQNEFDAVTKPLPTLLSQQDRLKFYGAGIAASELLNQAKDQARILYDNTHSDKSEAGFQKYWQSTPQYQKGIFGITDPSTGLSPWAGVNLGTANGKPVPFVQLDPKTGKYIVGAGLGRGNHQEF